MWAQRILSFLPSIAIVVAALLVIKLYFQKCFNGRFAYIIDDVEWQSTNRAKAFWLLVVPTVHLRAPLYEELLFRALLILAFPTLSSLAWVSIIFSGALFAIAHIQGGLKQMGVTFTIGVLSGYFGIVYQSLWVSIGVHAAWNTLASLVLFIFIPYWNRVWHKTAE